MKGRNVPPFVLFEDRLVSFVPPGTKDNPFRDFLSGSSPKEEKVAAWMADPDRRRQLVGLLNGALREHCYHLGIFTAKKDRTQFFCPIFEGGEPREFRWGSSGGSGGRSRALAKMKSRTNGTQFGVHMSAYMRFIVVGDRLLLLIEPGWLFTTDGLTPLEGKEVGRFSTLWGGKERNAAVLRNVLMWGLLVANGKREIMLNVATANHPVYVAVHSVPVHTKLTHGVGGDSIRLDRILGGDGAGEVKREASAEDAELDRELDEVADLALLGALTTDETASDQTMTEDPATDDAIADDGGDDGEEEELELPF